MRNEYGILHYNGGADGGEVSPAAPADGGAGGSNLPMPRYRDAIMRDGAGNDCDQIDMVELTIFSC